MQHRVTKFSSAAFFVTSLALASDTWIIDSSRSNARLFHNAGANSESVNSGVAHVIGKVKLDTNNLDSSFFDLSIYPADDSWEHVLNPEGTLPTVYVPRATDRSLLTFKSTGILRKRNGTLEVIGNLTLTRVECTAIATPTAAYAGAVYGDLVIHNENREITFVLPSTSAEHLSGPLTASTEQKRGVLEIMASARVEREECSKVLGAIKETSWPLVVQNKDCHMPSRVGKDYTGASSTGKAIAANRDNNCDVPTSGGEDYSGFQCIQATGNQTTIVLDLKFLHKVPEPSLEADAGAESIGMPLQPIGRSR